MAKSLITLLLLCASLSAQVTGSASPTADDEGNPGASSAQSVNPVFEWNRTLLVIVRTPVAQPPTIHSTRSFAILHAGIQPGGYQLTPPNFAAADFTQWPQVTPFALARADEFRPGPPPELTSDEYTSVFDEVKSLGFIHSTTRTPEQTLIGMFWNGNIQDFWNEIAQTAALRHHLNLAQSARLFALLNISLADTAIAFFDAKYTYQFWRPVTAIQMAGSDGNPSTEPNPAWLPLTTKTAPDPAYPGAHSAISSAGAEVLRFYFGKRFTFDVTSESLAGVTRHFTSFSAAAEEAGLSRIYAGAAFPLRPRRWQRSGPAGGGVCRRDHSAS